MKRVAVIGSGISGLGAAWLLSRRFEVSLFEKDDRVGGHTHTVMVDTADGPLPVDTGFIVHTERNYPNFIRLMRELGVETQASDMSFAVTAFDDDFEYSSRGLRGFFAKRSNALRPSHYKLLTEIMRFNREAMTLASSPLASRLTLGEMLDRGRFGNEFRERYLYPMASAVWSMSFAEIAHFPAAALVKFFEHHGMLGIDTHPEWRVIRGGSFRYIAPISEPFRERVVTGAKIARVSRDGQGVEIHFDAGASQRFDEVVFACHGDQVLPLLEMPTDAERAVFSKLRTSSNETVLHTDSRLLPRRPDARASWNYGIDPRAERQVSVTYHMNRLQTLKSQTDYCVTLNGTDRIDPSKIVKSMVYHHPSYDQGALDAQARWSEVSGVGHTHFCGAYWYYGFHEDGLRSAIRVASALGVEW
ncbi:MAG: FAD-dependent oxidoreductase [Thermoanaerobaculia bacterium]|nr:FAD-dependent oxidoreductase [Thermoanaerobaculia bacterium]